jgi:hypothetical protein
MLSTTGFGVGVGGTGVGVGGTGVGVGGTGVGVGGGAGQPVLIKLMTTPKLSTTNIFFIIYLLISSESAYR